jgi:hypothetical protein
VQLETQCVFVVADGYVVELHGQEFPRYLRLTGRV